MGKYTIELPDGRVIYRASALGSCSNALYMDRLGITGEPTPDWLQARFDQGKAGEEPILDALYQDKHWRLYLGEQLVKMGYQLGEDEYVSQVQVWIRITDNVWVRGHTDGVGFLWNSSDSSRLGEKRGIEVKLFGEALWKQYKRHGLTAFPGYQMQLAAYMRGLGLPFLFVVGLRDDDGNLMRDENSKAVIDITEVDESPVPWSNVIAKVLRVEAMLKNGTQPKCELPYMYPCPYYQLHDDDAAEELPDTERLLVDTLALEHDRHKELAAKHKKQQGEIAKQIATYLDEKGFGSPEAIEGQSRPSGTNKTWLGKHVQITDVRYWRKGFVDEGKLEADGIKVDDYRQPGSEVRYPKVTRRKTGDRGGE